MIKSQTFDQMIKMKGMEMENFNVQNFNVSTKNWPKVLDGMQCSNA